MLRSASQWSIGCKQSVTERSIYTAYLNLIRTAKHFIYIENQFFVSAVRENDAVENKIADAMIDRIREAIVRK